MNDNSATRRPCIKMKITDGILSYRQVSFRKDTVKDVDLAVHRLLLGEVVWVAQVATVTNAIQKTLEAVLKQPAMSEVAGDD